MACDTMAQAVRNDNSARSAYYQEVLEKLATYEDLEEHGRLIIICEEQRDAMWRLANYPADDNYFDSEYS